MAAKRTDVIGAAAVCCQELVGAEKEVEGRGAMRPESLAGSGLAGLLGFSGDGMFCGGAGIGKTRRRWDDVGNRRWALRKEGGTWVDQSADEFGGSHRYGPQQFVVIEHPAREHRLRGFLDPSIDQHGDFLAKIRRMIQTGQLKTLKRSAGSGLQIIERR
jgi:hypothetical protein